jgi:hypothetical protein
VITGSAALLAGGAIAGAAGGAGLAYLARDQIEGILGQGEDLSGYTGKEALRTQIEEQSLTMRTVDERVFTSIENNLANSETVAFAKGKVAALEKMNVEAPEADAVTAMEEAVDDYYSTIQKNILVHWETQTSQINHHVAMVNAHPDVSVGNWFVVQEAGVTYDEDLTQLATGSFTLVSGETYELDTIRSTRIDNTLQPSISNFANTWFKFTGGSSGVKVFERALYNNLLSSVADRSSSVKTKLEAFIGDLYLEYGAGDIPTEDVIDPVTAATQLGQNTGMAGQAAEAAMLGIPTSASFSLWLELQDADGNTFEVEAELYTKASPTDGSGNETGWEVGTTYDPVDFAPPIYVAYEYIAPDSGDKSTDFVQLDEPFTVLEATDAEGNEVTNVANEKRITQTADVTKLEEELAQLRDEQQRLQQQSQGGSTTGSGGAGGFLDGGNSTLLAALAAVAGGAVLFGGNS